ncbi:AraC family transcriptional regulator [Pseudomonas sp. RL_15y_Pfl2_60]|uniref:AraC family transcriptional regulator n=1 Tax=Pseudomonas sp. RL_15y_Pfl2_60 TaxID=3088709 RepID=UPI0030D6D6E4
MHPLLSLRHYSHDLLSHSHDHAQLVFGLNGLLEFEAAGVGSRVVRQSVAIVPAATEHACGSPAGSDCLVLDIPSEGWLKEHLGAHADAGLRLTGATQSLSLNTVQGQLVSWLAASPINDPVIAQQGAALLLASLLSEQSGAASSEPRLPLHAIDRYIHEHAAHPLQVADLARLAGLSSARFHSRFLAETGCTPMEYVRNQRLELARQMLQTSHLGVGEIAARVGYSSQSAFSAALSRYFGCTARSIRAAQQ